MLNVIGVQVPQLEPVLDVMDAAVVVEVMV